MERSDDDAAIRHKAAQLLDTCSIKKLTLGPVRDVWMKFCPWVNAWRCERNGEPEFFDIFASLFGVVVFFQHQPALVLSTSLQHLAEGDVQRSFRSLANAERYGVLDTEEFFATAMWMIVDAGESPQIRDALQKDLEQIEAAGLSVPERFRRAAGRTCGEVLERAAEAAASGDVYGALRVIDELERLLECGPLYQNNMVRPDEFLKGRLHLAAEAARRILLIESPATSSEDSHDYEKTCGPQPNISHEAAWTQQNVRSEEPSWPAHYVKLANLRAEGYTYASVPVGGTAGVEIWRCRSGRDPIHIFVTGIFIAVLIALPEHALVFRLDTLEALASSEIDDLHKRLQRQFRRPVLDTDAFYEAMVEEVLEATFETDPVAHRALQQAVEFARGVFSPELSREYHINLIHERLQKNAPGSARAIAECFNGLLGEYDPDGAKAKLEATRRKLGGTESTWARRIVCPELDLMSCLYLARAVAAKIVELKRQGAQMPGDSRLS